MVVTACLVLFGQLLTGVADAATPTVRGNGGTGLHIWRGGTPRCLDAVLASLPANETKVQLYDCNGGKNQGFYLYGDGTIRNGFNTATLCLEADVRTVPDNGTKVQVSACNGTPQQKWHYKGNRQVMNELEGCLDADPATIGSNGTKMRLWTCAATVPYNQQWFEAPNLGGTTIFQAGTGRRLLLDVTNERDPSVFVVPSTGPSSSWKLFDAGSPASGPQRVRICDFDSGQCLRSSGLSLGATRFPRDPFYTEGTVFELVPSTGGAMNIRAYTTNVCLQASTAVPGQTFVSLYNCTFPEAKWFLTE